MLQTRQQTGRKNLVPIPRQARIGIPTSANAERRDYMRETLCISTYRKVKIVECRQLAGKKGEAMRYRMTIAYMERGGAESEFHETFDASSSKEAIRRAMERDRRLSECVLVIGRVSRLVRIDQPERVTSLIS